MVPRASGGTSFFGAAKYYFHDKREPGEGHRRSAERVGWTHTENCLSSDPWDAIYEMIDVARRNPHCEKPVYTLALSWHPDQNPSRQDMIEAGRAAVKAVGMAEHEAIFVAHTDEPHPHLHVIINRVHPVTLKAQDIFRDHLKLSEFALEFEREGGKILCPQREKNHERREAGEFVKYADNTIAESWDRSDSGRSFAAALAARNFTLAQGDKAGRYIAVTPSGAAMDILRELNKGRAKGDKLRKKDISARFADIPLDNLPTVDAVQKARAAEKAADSRAEKQQEAPPPAAKATPQQPQQPRIEYGGQVAEPIPADHVPARTRRRETARFEVWANGLRARTQSRQLDEKGGQGRAHTDQQRELTQRLSRQHGPQHKTERAELAAIRQRQQRGGWWYRLTRAAADRERAAELRANLADRAQRVREERGRLSVRHQADKHDLAQRHERERNADEERIENARARREADGWKPLPPRETEPEQEREDTRHGDGDSLPISERVQRRRQERRQRGDRDGPDREREP